MYLDSQTENKYVNFFVRSLLDEKVSFTVIGDIIYVSYTDICRKIYEIKDINQHIKLKLEKFNCLSFTENDDLDIDYDAFIDDHDENWGSIIRAFDRIDEINAMKNASSRKSAQKNFYKKHNYVDIDKAFVLMCYTPASDKASKIINDIVDYYHKNAYPEIMKDKLVDCAKFVDIKNNVLVLNGKRMQTFNEYEEEGGKIKDIWIHYNSLVKILDYTRGPNQVKDDYFKDDADEYITTYGAMRNNKVNFNIRCHQNMFSKKIMENLSESITYVELREDTSFVNIAGMIKLVTHSKMKNAVIFQKWIYSVLLKEFFMQGAFSARDIDINYWYEPSDEDEAHIIANKMIGVYILQINNSNVYKYGITNRSGGVGERIDEHARKFKHGKDSFKLIFFLEHTVNAQIEQGFKMFLRQKGLAGDFTIDSPTKGPRFKYHEIFRTNEEYSIKTITEQLLQLARLNSTGSHRAVTDLKKELGVKEVRISDLEKTIEKMELLYVRVSNDVNNLKRERDEALNKLLTCDEIHSGSIKDMADAFAKEKKQLSSSHVKEKNELLKRHAKEKKDTLKEKKQLIKSHAKEKKELIARHSTEISRLDKQITTLQSNGQNNIIMFDKKIELLTRDKEIMAIEIMSARNEIILTKKSINELMAKIKATELKCVYEYEKIMGSYDHKKIVDDTMDSICSRFDALYSLIKQINDEHLSVQAALQKKIDFLESQTVGVRN